MKFAKFSNIIIFDIG